jgi:3-hydroxy-5-methyl-1-naphthoate 3-O-methyltransferase
MAKATENSEVTPQKLQQDLWAVLGAQALTTGVELDIFTIISEGNRTPKEVARRAKASQRGVRMLMDALTGMGYLNKRGETYGLEPISDKFLVSGKPTYMGSFASTTSLTRPGWAQLGEVVKTGKPVAAVDAEEAGKEFFPKLVAILFPGSYAAARSALAGIPAKTAKKLYQVLDVAAGSGAWSIPFAQANKDTRVTVVDFPEVTPITREFTAKFGVADQYDYIEENLRHADFGKNQYDLVILGHIIHSEGEKWGKNLIKKCYRALKEGGLLLIAEMVPNDTRTGPVMPLLFGLNMLVHTADGDVFTMKEYRQWLKGVGFKRVTTIDAPSPSPLILATK